MFGSDKLYQSLTLLLYNLLFTLIDQAKINRSILLLSTFKDALNLHEGQSTTQVLRIVLLP